MEKREITQLLQHYFDGISTPEEEKILRNYFRSENVAGDLKKYSGFFSGIAELSESDTSENMEEEIMNFILEKESNEKSHYKWLWQTVTGIAATVILVIGGLLFYQQRNMSFEETFENPEVAYAYAEQTLGYISAKYNEGLAELANFEKLNSAAEPLQKGVKPVNELYEKLNRINSNIQPVNNE